MIFWLASCATEEKPIENDSGSVLVAFANAGAPLSGIVNEPLVFDGSNSTGIDFEWYFGDGSSSTDIISSHAFDAPGTYQAVLTAFGENGLNHTDAISVSIQHPPTELAPVISSSITTTEDEIWAVFPENGTISQLSSDGELITEWSICDSPQQLAYSDGVIGISCRSPAELVLLSLDSGERTHIELPENTQPYGIVGRDDQWWVTLNASGELAQWDGEVLSTTVLGPDPRGLTLTADGSLMAPQWRAGLTGAHIYHIQGDLVSTILLGLDTNGDSDNTTGGAPNLLEQVVPSMDGLSLFIPMLHANVLRGGHISGAPLTFESSLRGMLATIELSDSIEYPERRKHFDERGRSSAVVSSPLGDKLYVLHPSAGHISLLDRYDLETIGAILNVGVGSSGLGISPDGNTLYVHAWLDRKIRAYDTQSLSHTPLWEAPLSFNEPLDDEILLGKRIFHSAADPRITRSQYIACSHCHPDGDHDGQTWDFTDRGEGLRNTTSLLGRGGTNMGPLHWTGNFDEVQDFESDMRLHFGGSGFLDDETFSECSESLGPPKAGLSEALDALDAYLTSLPMPPRAPISPIENNAETFDALECGECHPAPLYTDSNLNTFLRHNIGTLKPSSGLRMGEPLDGLDTPTLLGLWGSAPYLHDGSVQTVEEAIRKHDGYNDISEGDMMLLINFLQTQ